MALGLLVIDRNVKCWQSWICSVSKGDPCRSCLNSPVDHFLFFAHVLYMYYRKLCTLNVHSFLSRFTKLCRTISNQDVERPNILSAHTLCIYLFASELKQLTSLCNNQNKVFATCTQLTGDSPACSKLSGREKERKAPAANFATHDSNPCSVWWGKDGVQNLQILQISSPLNTLFPGVWM